jgi:large subunit ribosomal protein L23
MNIIIKPIITEKATSQSELFNCYSFLVDTNANKIEIKKAVESVYGVSVNKVRTLNYGPIRKTKYTKTGIQNGKTNANKKAVVHLAEGDTIDFFSKL